MRPITLTTLRNNLFKIGRINVKADTIIKS